jgi:hypothetical protein
VVHRPDPGLARGKWEAPAWAFYVALAVAMLLAALFVAQRFGVFKRSAQPGGTPPRSIKP